VSLTEVKLKVGEILAECGTQEAEKACKWFLLWHNRWAQLKIFHTGILYSVPAAAVLGCSPFFAFFGLLLTWAQQKYFSHWYHRWAQQKIFKTSRIGGHNNNIIGGHNNIFQTCRIGEHNKNLFHTDFIGGHKTHLFHTGR
jgi:hypothetical protein